jgi:hypothetical protein
MMASQQTSELRLCRILNVTLVPPRRHIRIFPLVHEKLPVSRQ